MKIESFKNNNEYLENKPKPVLGKRLVQANIITERQRKKLVEKQAYIRSNEGRNVRFGDLAVECGYCSARAIDSLKGFIGERLVDAGFLDSEQKDQLLKWQNRLRSRGVEVRLGYLAISEGLCNDSDIQSLMAVS